MGITVSTKRYKEMRNVLGVRRALNLTFIAKTMKHSIIAFIRFILLD